ncbi:MAG: hypothetical protein ABI425_04020 [Patescibacteria group bacterium]
MSKNRKHSQTGWTTMEYVVGAIALVGVVTLVLKAFGEKLVAAIETLKLI